MSGRRGYTQKMVTKGEIVCTGHNGLCQTSSAAERIQGEESQGRKSPRMKA